MLYCPGVPTSAWAVLQTWMLNRTQGSPLLASVLPASEIWVAYAMLRGGIGPAKLDNYWGMGRRCCSLPSDAGYWTPEARSRTPAPHRCPGVLNGELRIVTEGQVMR